eukprot:UN06924
MSVSMTDDIAEEIIVDAITNSIAESLGVHSSDIDVVIDMTTGEVEFVVTSDEYMEIVASQLVLHNGRQIDSMIDNIESILPSISIET